VRIGAGFPGRVAGENGIRIFFTRAILIWILFILCGEEGCNPEALAGTNWKSGQGERLRGNLAALGTWSSEGGRGVVMASLSGKRRA